MGDGDSLFYPTCSCPDVLAHEIGHAVVGATSKLVYYGDSGCLNEAFADMTGETFKNFIGLANDFMIGSKCLKSKEFLRDMSKPMQISEVFFGMQNHQCSGVFNYVFYLLSKDWGVQKTYRLFSAANRFFWTYETDLPTAACDVASLASQWNLYRHEIKLVVDSFQAVGINTSLCVSSQLPSPVKELTNCETQQNLKADKGEVLEFSMSLPKRAKMFWVTISGPSGNADLYVNIGNQQPLSADDWQWKANGNGSHKFIREKLPKSKREGNEQAFVSVAAVDSFDNLKLYACFF